MRIATVTAFPHVSNNEAYLDAKTNSIIEVDLTRYGKICKENATWRIIKDEDSFRSSFDSVSPRGIVLHIEGLNSFTGDPTSWKMLERWYELGLRSVGIVWNLSNSLGGGTLDTTRRLTPLGRDVINWLQRKNMIVDFAHMNEATFWDAADIVRGPIVISHGNSRSICDDPRNYTDEQLQRVAASGGIIGVFFSKKFLVSGRDATIGDVIVHIDHLRNIMGIDHVAIGTDFGGILSGFPGKLQAVDRLPLLWDALVEHGYDHASIEKIAYVNALRVIGSILGANQPV